MSRWTPIPIAGGDYEDDTRPQSCQETVNFLPVKAERPGTRADWILRPVPGMSLFAEVGTGPIRGKRDVEGKLFVVSGSELYRVYGAGSSELIGTIPGVGRVSMTHNQITGGNELVIGNGSSGYVYNTATEVLTQITDEGFPGFRMADFIDGYIWGTEPLGRFGFHSDLADATSYNTLDRTEAEALPDRIVGHIASHGEVLVLSERSGEFFTNTGAGTGTFQRMDGTSLEVGCASWASIAKLDNSPFWMGNDGILYRLNGYQAMPISTGPMAQAFSKVDLSKCFATTYEDRGHKIYYLTSQDGQTWGYDVTTGEVHRRETYGYNRWRLNTLTKWNGAWIGGDFNSGKLYQLRWGHMKEGDDPLVRRRVSGVLHDSGNRLTVNAIRVEMDTGVDAVQAALPTLSLVLSGAAPDWAVGIEYEPFQYATSGGQPAYGDYTISAGALPTGLSMSVTGEITGTPTVAGPFSWTISRTDTDGNVATLADGATISALWTPASLPVIDTKSIWLDASVSADSLTAGTTGSYRTWADEYNGHAFTTSSEIPGAGSQVGEINGRRSCFPSDGGSADFGATGTSGAAIKAAMAAVRYGHVSAIWRKDVADTVAADRRIIYWSVETPGNGNNERLSLRCSAGTGLENGARSVARQDYLDTAYSVTDDTDRETAIVIAFASVDWQTGERSLYVNGELIDSTPLVGFTGLSDSESSLKVYVGTTDQATVKCNAHIGEIVAQGLAAPLSVADRQNLEGYYAWLWRGTKAHGDPVAALPADHPYKSRPPLA